MKKMLSVIGLAAMLSTGSIYADSFQNSQDNGCCPKDDCCASGFYVCADFLYWTLYDADLDYAANNSAISGLDVAGTGGSESKMHFAEYDWDPAFRVLGGYRDECGGWDIRVSYLYFESDKTSSTSYGDGTNEHLKPTVWSPSFNCDRAQSATAKVEVEYHLYDITLGRECCICDGFKLRPFGGFRGMTLDQSMYITYSGGRDFTAEDGIVDWESSFDGYGLVGGFDWNLEFCDCICLYGTVAATVLGGETDDRETQSGPENPGPTGQGSLANNINVREEQWIGVPGYQLALGVCYDSSFESCGCCIDYMPALGYEVNHWFNVPEVRRFTGGVQEAANNGGGAKGCLLFHGLTLRGCITF